MHIIFHKDFYDSSYSDEPAAKPGRMESIINELKKYNHYNFIQPLPAEERDILAAHDSQCYQGIKSNKKIYDIALLSAGSVIKASELAINDEIAFSVNRPPGHHAYKNMNWGYCYFSNIAIALIKLFNEKKIKNAFVLDFDAHTGDGTIDILKKDYDVKILNPMAGEREKYLREVNNYLNDIDYVDIIAISAGFDSYELDVGSKLKTFDYFLIGRELKKFAKKMKHNRIFAALEGGYYLPDLGKNVHSFCEGLNQYII